MINEVPINERPGHSLAELLLHRPTQGGHTSYAAATGAPLGGAHQLCSSNWRTPSRSRHWPSSAPCDASVRRPSARWTRQARARVAHVSTHEALAAPISKGRPRAQCGQKLRACFRRRGIGGAPSQGMHQRAPIGLQA